MAVGDSGTIDLGLLFRRDPDRRRRSDHLRGKSALGGHCIGNDDLTVQGYGQTSIGRRIRSLPPGHQVVDDERSEGAL